MNTINTLEFNIILERLSDFALSAKAKEKLRLLKPFLSERECKNKMKETTSALKILDSIGNPPLTSMPELEKILELAVKGSMLIPEQLISICSFITSCKRMKNYLKKAEFLDVSISSYGGAFYSLDLLFEEINRSIRNGAVDSEASATLRGTRKKIENLNSDVKDKLEKILRSKRDWFEDGYVATRNGRFVLPVKNKYKNQVAGTVIDTSNTGGTCFIEPTAVRKLQEQLAILQIEEENEVRKILYTLTSLVDDHMNELRINIDCMEALDFIFAKAKLSMELKAIPVPITTERKIIIKQGRHPLLASDVCVPLNFEIGGEINGVVITGPNTGGKTVTLKTVGLLSLMAQSGLHVPVVEGSIFCMHNNILCDIGDGQSIAANLSTFSAHITNIIDILKNVTDESFVLLDELGSGTDPAEGMGIAISILAELKERNCLFLVTTHYPEIKDFAKKTDGLVNARMEFDRETLRPLYKLQIGEAGESCALYIAQRLGFPIHMLARAEKEAYNKNSLGNDNQNMIFKEEKHKIDRVKTNKIKKDIEKQTSPIQIRSFDIGDSVKVYPEKSIGIICKEANEKGEYGVQIKGKKQRINHKRIKLIASAGQLYPEDYDFSIIFDTKENRKARHNLDRKFDPSVAIEYEKEI
ncbi:MAG: DNA mismatch repair protein MutS [Anaerovorax sp.]|nr:DNA mismatch repair protein MutS [Anaerovorax sp.]